MDIGVLCYLPDSTVGQLVLFSIPYSSGIPSPLIIELNDIDKLWNILISPVSIKVWSQKSFAKLPVLWIPSRLMPIDNGKYLTRCISRHHYVAWMEISMDEDNSWAVWKKLPPRIRNLGRISKMDFLVDFDQSREPIIELFDCVERSGWGFHAICEDDIEEGFSVNSTWSKSV